MNFNHLPEEQENPELVNNLQEIYRMSSEKKATLARIEARLFEHAPAQARIVRTGEPLDAERYQHENVRDPRLSGSWQHRLGVLAAVFAVVLITSAMVATFLLLKNKGQPSSAPSRPGTVHETVSPPSQQLLKYAYINDTGIRMVTEQDGWAMNTTGTNSYVFRTTDGGKTWVQILPPHTSISDIAAVDVFTESMAFIRLKSDHQHFYRTVDGGASWQFLAWPGAQINSQGVGFVVAFLDAMHGWVNVSQPGTAGGGVIKPEKQTLFRTTDGGHSWQQVAILPPNIDVVTITFTNLNTGWFATPGPQPVLYRTHDGGQSWSQQALSALLHETQNLKSLQSPIFFTAREGSLIATFGSESSQGESYLYTTQDAGDSWQRSGSVLPPAMVYVVDTTHLLVVESSNNSENTASGFLLALTNGQWIQASNPLAVKDYDSMDFVNAQVGLALVRTADSNVDVYKTEDGGTAWLKVGSLPKGA